MMRRHNWRADSTSRAVMTTFEPTTEDKKHRHHKAMKQLVADFGPLFPRHVGEKPALPFDHESWVEYEAARRDQYVNVMLPYWQKLVPVYAAALAYPFGDDTGQMQISVEVCPADMDAQQNSLLRLFEESKLRMAWRSLAEWYVTQQAYYTDGQRKALAELKREHHEGSNPLAEIPLYQSYLRASCHQLICMPVSQWDAMFSQTAKYEPGQIDAKTIKRLALRIARVFNTPPLADVEFLAQSPSWCDPTVWRVSEGSLTESKSCHGMDDRLFDEYGRPHYPDTEDKPSWRFDGFCAQIRVILEDGTPWYVTVLAPAHFVHHVMYYPNR